MLKSACNKKKTYIAILRQTFVQNSPVPSTEPITAPEIRNQSQDGNIFDTNLSSSESTNFIIRGHSGFQDIWINWQRKRAFGSHYSLPSMIAQRVVILHGRIRGDIETLAFGPGSNI